MRASERGWIVAADDLGRIAPVRRREAGDGLRRVGHAPADSDADGRGAHVAVRCDALHLGGHADRRRLDLHCRVFRGRRRRRPTPQFRFAVLAGSLLYALLRSYARRDIALASVCLVASTPLAFLETSTLYVENLWLAFLLGTLLLALDYLRTRRRERCWRSPSSPQAPCSARLSASSGSRRLSSSSAGFRGSGGAIANSSPQLCVVRHRDCHCGVALRECLAAHRESGLSVREHGVPLAIVQYRDVIQQSVLYNAPLRLSSLYETGLVERPIHRRVQWRRRLSLAAAVPGHRPGLPAAAVRSPTGFAWRLP